MAIDYNKTGAEKDFDFVHDLLNDYWKNIAINIFEWKRKNGEPLETISEGLTSTQIEEELYDKGSSLFFKDENIGYMALPVAPANKLNVYRKPTNFRAEIANIFNNGITIWHYRNATTFKGVNNYDYENVETNLMED